ncbi:MULTISPECIES: SatD family protein [unclassified Rathayibacter]|uniref:SatD family protein n=1 Tax=unclassified Rathayibacter TaxID=2609250 RepID=UPI0006FA62A1|nr:MULTISPECIES: SatD family protein [unclassified Rathayibacter]KQQ01334.1 hypothetical protein ASF42_12660 [Rathayibacter sp. Leaf294]KQS11365.1 hypothetical protein ASG06_12660 [Rathayibacter sp. Leaf185]
MTSSTPVAVLLDLVGSRTIVERDAAQILIELAFEEVDQAVPALEALHATVGDEFQAVYASVAAALVATLQARLSLPEGIDCRVGLGAGAIRVIGSGTSGALQDGPGWWRARAAIDRAHELQDTGVPTARGWYIASDAPDAPDAGEASINAYLLARDTLVSPLSSRDRRLVLGTLRGRSQRALADEESISQSAVSQALRRSGAGALLAGARLLEDQC